MLRLASDLAPELLGVASGVGALLVASSSSVELPSWSLAVLGAFFTVVVALSGWSLKRNIGGLDARFTDLAAQIGRLQARLEERSERTGEHAVSLGIVSAQLVALEKRLEHLEANARKE
jgi:membrane protein implicated in regulation of membrane protease activity